MIKMNCPRCNCVLDVVLEINAKKLERKIMSASKHDLLMSVAAPVCNFFSITVGDLKGEGRKTDMSLKRHIYFWMARKYLPEKTISPNDIASFISKDRTSYMNGATKIDKIMMDGKEGIPIYDTVVSVEHAYVHDASATVGEFEELTSKIGKPIESFHHYKTRYKYIPKSKKNETTS